MRYVVYGAGAIGGAIGARLFEAGSEVVLIARGAHLEALKATGLTYGDPVSTRVLAIAAVGHPADVEWRGDDVVVLANAFAARVAKRIGRAVEPLSAEDAAQLRAYAWPGNIRELQNVIERAVIMSDGETLSIDVRWLAGRSPSSTAANSVAAAPPPTTLATQTKEVIEAALRESKGRVAGPFGAAGRLGVPASTLESKIKVLKIDKRCFKPPSRGVAAGSRHFATTSRSGSRSRMETPAYAWP